MRRALMFGGYMTELKTMKKIEFGRSEKEDRDILRLEAEKHAKDQDLRKEGLQPTDIVFQIADGISKWIRYFFNISVEPAETTPMRLSTKGQHELNIVPTNTIHFEAERLTVGSDNLCLDFKDSIMELDNIKTLEFVMAGKRFTFKKE